MISPLKLTVPPLFHITASITLRAFAIRESDGSWLYAPVYASTHIPRVSSRNCLTSNSSTRSPFSSSSLLVSCAISATSTSSKATPKFGIPDSQANCPVSFFFPSINSLMVSSVTLTKASFHVLSTPLGLAIFIPQ